MLSGNIKRIKIYLDTNVIEARHEESCLTLNTIKLHPDFYKLLDFCKDITEARIYIPEIVWKEVCAHLISNFNSTLQSMQTKINLYKKTFGDLIDLNLELKGNSKGTYPAYVEQISDEFWSTMKDRCELAPIKRTDSALIEIVNKAIMITKPFTTAKGKNNKDYTDAGLKDAVIVETILSCCNEDEIGILFTGDMDFNAVFQQYDCEKYFAVRTLDGLKNQINAILKRNDDYVVKAIFEQNTYMQETLFEALGLVYDKSITQFEVQSISKEEEVYILQIQVCVNEVIYIMNVSYDSVANEIIDVKYRIIND